MFNVKTSNMAWRRYEKDYLLFIMRDTLSRGALNTTSMGAFKTSQLIFLFHTLFCHNPQV
jgi:esterase/lipase superfamily enzyme